MPYGRLLFVEFSGFVLPFFNDLPSQMAFFKLRYITFFLTYATTLRTLNLILRFSGIEK